ncbi:MAG: hypothetical protein NZM00_10255 [Anaerolinea sp.]|nr:hypothetical protein [Anaerolinea sp.]
MLQSAVWHTYPSIIALTFTGAISLDDCHVAINSIRELIASANLPDDAASVHILVDASGRTGFRADVLNIRALTEVALRVRRIGWIAVVDPHPNLMLQFAADTIGIRLGLRIRVFTTLADASHFLRVQSLASGSRSEAVAD